MRFANAVFSTVVLVAAVQILCAQEPQKLYYDKDSASHYVGV